MTDFAPFELIQNFLFLFTESAPFLLFGLFLAGIIHMVIPSSWVEKTLGKKSSVVTAAVIGAPVPLCSCSVIPTAIGIRRSGASKASTASFMVATPETGVDSVGVTYALMGPVMAVIRPISAVLAAIFTGTLVRLWDKESTEQVKDINREQTTQSSCCSSNEPKAEPKKTGCCSKKEPHEEEKTSSCCSTKKAEPVDSKGCCSASQTAEKEAKASSCCSSNTPKSEPKTASCCSSKKPEEEVKTSSCCSNKQKEPEVKSCCSSKAKENTKTNLLTKVWNAVKYAYGKLLGDFMKWLLIGLVFAAVIKTFVPAEFLANHGSGILAMAIMVIISVPMYICATASTPIAAGLMLSGISPGAALVFMMAGPATNIATIMVVKNELGSRSVLAYLVGVIGSAIILGLLTDLALNATGISIVVSAGEHGEMISRLYIISAFVLAALIGWNGYDRLIRSKQQSA